MCLSAIVLLLSCRLWKPHCAGEVLPKFSIDSLMFLFFCKEETVEAEPEYLGGPIVFLAADGLPALLCLAIAPTRHGPTSLTPPPP
jgi:hypothetical protein